MPKQTPSYIKEAKEGILLMVHVQPRASRNKIVGPHGERLKIAVQSPPADGKANKALQKLLAKHLGIPKSNVVLRSGHVSREKTFLLKDITLTEILSRL